LWLEEVERTLESIPDLGVAGVAGMSEKGRNDEERRKWCIDVFDEVWWDGGNNRVERPEEVQTLDECLLIVRRPVFSRLQFDDKVFDGWHCYGADYCLSVRQFGLKAYVVPAFACHSCLRANMKDLLKFQQRLYVKHRRNYKHIYT
jgi:GT2 family glycosyltransferase